MIAALILAAGKGVRFESAGLPKQFCEISGKPLFVHSVETYVGIDAVDRVIVVANPQYVDMTTYALERYDLLEQVTIIVGGNTRQVSIQNACTLIAGQFTSSEDFVILHNGVSPNTSAEFVNTCLTAVADRDAVQACVPDTRTVFEIDGEFVKRLLPRPNLVCHCDPIVYRGDVFSHVLDEQKRGGMSGDTTSDTALELGYRIRLVRSDYGNIKVTTRWDLEAVRAAMEQGRQ